MKKNKRQEETTKETFVVDMVDKEEEQEKKDLRVISTIFTCIIIIAAIVLINAFTVVKDYTQDKVVLVLIALLMISLLVGVAGFTIVKKTIGWKLAILLFKLRKKKNKGYILTRIFDLSGIIQYRMIKASLRNTYKYIENGVKTTKMFFFDPYARYQDFNGIPVVDVSPNDINPKNPATGTRINISPEVIEKNIADNSKSAEQIDTLKQWRKWLIIILVILLVGGFISFDLFAQRLAEANEATIACYKAAGKSATIIASPAITKLFRR